MALDPAPLLANLAAFRAFVARRLDARDGAADDVVQQALARALVAADQLRDDDRLLPWFWRILRNTVEEVRRRRATAARVIAPLPAELDALPAPEVAAVCACLGRALDGLPDAQAAALRAVDLDGEAPAAAAARLGVTENALNVRRHRGRQALHAALLRTCRLCAEHGCLDCDCGPPPPGTEPAGSETP
ncbi:MAG: sigma factor-like helix-turn-helix DNA-binding protein [Planctomycetota bacterium]